MTTPTAINNDTLRLDDSFTAHLVKSVVLSVLGLVGVTGNTLVVVIFGIFRKRPKTSYSVFMVTMGTIDVVTCAVIIPWNIVVTFIPPTNSTPIFWFHICAAWSVYSTMLMCVMVAIDRYLSVCRPLSTIFTYQRAKRICGFSVLVSLGLAFLAVVPPAWIGSSYGATVAYLGTMVIILTLYALVWRAIRIVSTARVGAAPAQVFTVTTAARTSSSSTYKQTDSQSHQQQQQQQQQQHMSQRDHLHQTHHLEQHDENKEQHPQRQNQNDRQEDEELMLEQDNLQRNQHTYSLGHDLHQNHLRFQLKTNTQLCQISHEQTPQSRANRRVAFAAVNENEEMRMRSCGSNMGHGATVRVRRFTSSRRTRTTVMFCMVAVVFLLSWMPSWLWALRVPIISHTRSIIFINNVTNPFIYYLLNKRFANEIISIFRRPNQ